MNKLTSSNKYLIQKTNDSDNLNIDKCVYFKINHSKKGLDIIDFLTIIIIDIFKKKENNSNPIMVNLRIKSVPRNFHTHTPHIQP